MKIYAETNLDNFNAWSGGLDTKNAIINAGKEDEFDEYIEELYPDGIDATMLNDILWFDRDSLYEMLGLNEDGELIENDDDNDYERDEDED